MAIFWVLKGLCGDVKASDIHNVNERCFYSHHTEKMGVSLRHVSRETCQGEFIGVLVF
jgi:hypothetical protein